MLHHAAADKLSLNALRDGDAYGYGDGDDGDSNARSQISRFVREKLHFSIYIQPIA